MLTNDEQGLPLGNGLDAVLDSCFGYKKVGARNLSEPDTNLLVVYETSERDRRCCIHKPNR